MNTSNRDEKVVQGFGDEWTRFSQDALSNEEAETIFSDYFDTINLDELPIQSLVADIGCGSGRWAAVIAPKVSRLVCIDASIDALDVARGNLANMDNVEFHHADVGDLPFKDGELDFAYSLGVLHHVPDTAGAIANVARAIKPGGVFLVYLYYAFDNRPWWFRLVWRISDTFRRVISRMPKVIRFIVCELIAAFVYWPLARSAAILERMDVSSESFPLWYYRDKSFYVMRTDALDRFGTRLEKRFTRDKINKMLVDAGFGKIRFSGTQPYWCALGVKMM